MSKRVVFLGLTAAVLLLGGIAAYFLVPRWTAPSYESFRDDALADYLPEDAAGVVTVRMREVLQAPVVRRHFAGPLQSMLNSDPLVRRPFRLTGIDLFRDTDWVQVTVTPHEPGWPLVLLRGRYDLARFQVGPDKLTEEGGGPGGRYRVYKGPQAGFHLAPVGNTVALCASRPRLERALAHAAGTRPAGPVAAKVASLLGQVDRRQQVWLAVSFARLGGVARLSSRMAERFLRPVFTHAATVEGGLRLDDGVSGALRFRAYDGESAEALADHLGALVVLAQAGERFGAGLGVDRDWLPLFRLLGAAEVQRDGLTVLLRVHLPADALMRGPGSERHWTADQARSNPSGSL
jgi:hypothetical protein